MAILCIKSRYPCNNKIKNNQHRGQVKKMEMGRTYPTNGQEQQMLDGGDLDALEERLVDQRQRGDQLLKMKDAYWGGTAGTRPDA